ncbi:mitochondrial ATP synthase epsilon chain-domain-containing protein [Paraphysoderma sedebokerense]|nr:mitochondrial ATP synthase epsilon chain-domain-containing protein [Paraphysoderma sedebokerense]
MSVTYWRSAGLSYLQYSLACARAVRNSLKNEYKQAALRRSEYTLKGAKWENGKMGPSKPMGNAQAS